VLSKKFVNLGQIFFMKEKLSGLIRHALTFLGGLAVAKGLVEESMIAEVIGGVMTLIGAIWSISVKK
jgi:hypothetical protein